MKRKILLIDANSLIYRAFFALPTTLKSSKGQVTNAAYGFTSMLIKLLGEQRPDLVVAAFDKGKATFRHEEFKDYKAHRQPTPDDLKSQFPIVKEILGALQIPVIEMDGFEADDILATLATQAEQENDEVFVVTGDRDAFQLVDEHIKIMSTKKGISDIVIYDREKVLEKFGISPEQVTDYLALKGDPSDNIPGVPGFGEKTASKLIDQFGSLENLLDNLDQIENKRWRSILEENINEALLSKRLATMERDVPIDIDISTLEQKDWDREQLRKLFAELEFFSLLERLLGIEKVGTDREIAVFKDDSVSYSIGYIDKTELLESLKHDMGISEGAAIAIRSAGDNTIDQIINSLAIALKLEPGVSGVKEERVYVYAEAPQLTLDFGDSNFSKANQDEISASKIIDEIRETLVGSNKYIIAHDAKKILLSMSDDAVDNVRIAFDTMIASYLLHPDRSDYPIQELALANIGMAIDKNDEAETIAAEAIAILRLYKKLRQDLEEAHMTDLFERVEMPLIPVLARMERTGVRIDTEYLAELSKELDLQLEEIEHKIFSLAGQEFNINSPQQLGFILFEKLGLPKSKKTKTGYSTDAGVLAKLAPTYDICSEILSYRELTKLKSTYIDALPKLINSRTGRLHTSFNQAVTTTGRLSSSNPNLQNIPVRTDLGIRIRKAFIPANEGDLFLSADYSQIELRLLAHSSGEPVLLRAFEEGLDIHEATAIEVFGVEQGNVSEQMRRIAKMVNFGVLYGMSPYGLSDRLGIPVSEAKQFIDTYFKRLPHVEEFIKKTLKEATQKGYVETLLGRRRYIPELKSSNYQIRALGERFAVNAPLQGTAADIVKLAMISIDNELHARKLETKMVLQVHDELIFELSPAEKDVAIALVSDLMEHAFPLNVKLSVQINTGINWKDAK